MKKYISYLGYILAIIAGFRGVTPLIIIIVALAMTLFFDWYFCRLERRRNVWHVHDWTARTRRGLRLYWHVSRTNFPSVP